MFLAVSQQPGNRIPFGIGLQLLRAKWRYRKDPFMMMREPGPPSFYSPAKPNDVEGFEISAEVRNGVDGVVPMGYESYVWLPNPAWKWVEPEHDGAVVYESRQHPEEPDLVALPVKWSEVASANGKQMDKRTRWTEICGPHTDFGRRALSPNQSWTWAPREQNIEPSTVNTLEKVLSRWTSREDRCLGGKWEGSGSDWDTNPRIEFPNWTYFVWSCRFGDLIDWLKRADSSERESEMPHVVWPEDRSWFLAILYSGYSSYVAGPRPLINAILETDLEAYEVELTDQAH